MSTFLWILIVAIVVVIYYNVTTLAVYNGIKTFVDSCIEMKVVQLEEDENNE